VPALPGDGGRFPTAWSSLRGTGSLCEDALLVWEFLRTHPIPGSALFVGPFIFVLGLVIDAHHLIELGFPPQDLEALGAVIFALAVIGVLYKWWSEHYRVPAGSPNQFREQGTDIGPPPPGSAQQFLVPLDVLAGTSTDPKLVYPHKLRIVLRNDSGKYIIAGSPTWDSQIGDMPARPLSPHKWQIEGPRGWMNDDWSGEQTEVPVAPGKVIRTWTGLQHTVDQGDFRRRHEIKKIGTLVVPLQVEGQRIEQRIRI
jgi:hypothetical protein